jgi:hypothetical protein
MVFQTYLLVLIVLLLVAVIIGLILVLYKAALNNVNPGG